MTPLLLPTLIVIVIAALALDELRGRIQAGELSFALMNAKTRPLGERHCHSYGRAPSPR
jgi:hypothetical protein